jgi:hypothetical protein
VLSTAERQKYAILSSHKMAIHHILAMAVVKNMHRSLPWPIIDSTAFPQSPFHHQHLWWWAIEGFDL